SRLPRAQPDRLRHHGRLLPRGRALARRQRRVDPRERLPLPRGCLLRIRYRVEVTFTSNLRRTRALSAPDERGVARAGSDPPRSSKWTAIVRAATGRARSLPALLISFSKRSRR